MVVLFFLQVLKKLPSIKNKSTSFTETAVEIEKAIEMHNNKKTILRFLICSINHHGLNCFKPYCRLSKYLDLVNKILLSSDLLTEQKVERFQYQSRLYYQEFSQLYFRLKCFAGRARKKKNGNII